MRSEELQFLDMIRAYQKLSRSFSREDDSRISQAGFRVLVAVAENPGKGLLYLSKYLGVPKTTLSQQVSLLCGQKILRKTGRILELSEKGQRDLKSYQSKLDQTHVQASARLSDKELKRFDFLLNRLADGFDVPVALQPISTLPVREASRRIGRAVGTFGNQALHTPGLSVLHWIVLSDLKEISGQLTARHFCELLHCRPNTLSHALDALCQKKLIKRQKSNRDGRAKVLQLTDTGRAFLEKVEQKHEMRQRKAWQPFSPEDRIELLSLTARYLQVTSSEQLAILQPEIAIHSARSEADRSAIRRFIYKNFYAHSDLDIPESIAAASHESFALKVQGEIFAVLEMERMSSGKTRVVHFVYVDHLAEKYVEDFLKIVMRSESQQKKPQVVADMSRLSKMDSLGILVKVRELVGFSSQDS